jgi:UDP-2,3-diacylglucosamine hydrolase
MHFGREGGGAAEREVEAELIDCLEAHAGAVDHLYLVGDVFDAYVEYDRLVPKGFVRFQGLLARWTDRGVPVTYLVGNHDPWHLDYFETELGVRVVFDSCVAEHGGRRLYCTHGDAVAGEAGGLATRLRSLLRHPVPVWLYRSLLPADAGLALARWASRSLHGRGTRPDLIAALADHARTVLRSTDADAVVMGHSHEPILRSMDGGEYLNTGTWFAHRTFGCLDDDGLRLRRWNGTRALTIEPGSSVPAEVPL